MPEEPKKILIVDDEKPLARALALKLSNSGFSAKTAHDGEEALEILKKESFDLIILDLIMPKKDGFSVLKELKERNVSTKVIVSSNLSQEEDFKRAKELGAVAFFIKSDVSLTEIVDNVKKVLNTA